MSEQDNIRLAEEYAEAFNAHDYARMSSQNAEDIQVRVPGVPEPLDSAAVRSWTEGNWAAFPDHTIKINQIVAQGDYVVVNWTATGTHQGSLTTLTGVTIPATGRKFSFPGSTTTEFKNGKSVRSDYYWDNMTLFTQLGVTPGA